MREQVAQDRGWPLRVGESKRIARGLYAHLPDGTYLWQQRGVFVALDRARIADVLPCLQA